MSRQIPKGYNIDMARITPPPNTIKKYFTPILSGLSIADDDQRLFESRSPAARNSKGDQKPSVLRSS